MLLFSSIDIKIQSIFFKDLLCVNVNDIVPRFNPTLIIIEAIIIICKL